LALPPPARAGAPPGPPPAPTRRSSDLQARLQPLPDGTALPLGKVHRVAGRSRLRIHNPRKSHANRANRFQPETGVVHRHAVNLRSEEHASELQSRENLVCRLLLEKKST